MNPAQFQMGAMGVGMPNPMQQQTRPGPNLTPQQISRGIIQQLTSHTQSLQAQGRFLGWHSTVTIEQRAGQVKLLIDSLRLIQPVAGYDQVVSVALTFEQKAFSQEPTRDKYLATIKEKLSKIQETRTNQAQSQNTNLKQIVQPGQNMAFNLQLQQQMQAASMMRPGMAPQNPQVFPQMMGQAPVPPLNMQSRGNLPNQQRLTEEDNKNINQLAATMAKSLTHEQMARIRENLTDQQKMHMAQNNVDPLAYYFRAQATKEYTRRKFAAQQNAQMAGGQMQQQQMLQGGPIQNLGVQRSTSPFPGSIDRFQGQQADGMRSQEVGELVVPASIPQGMTPDQFHLQKQMLQNQQRQPTSSPNPLLAQQQSQQNRQAQAQAQARAQAAARAQLGVPGQTGMQGPSPSNTPLSQMNRTVGPNVQSVAAQGINRPPSRQPQQPPPVMPMQMGGQPQPGPPSQNPLANFPPELRALLQQKPRNEWKPIVQAFMAQQNNMRRTLSQQPNSGSLHNVQDQIQQLPHGPSPMQPSLSSGAIPNQGSLSRGQAETAQQMMQQQQQQRQQQQNQELARQRQIQMNQQLQKQHQQQFLNQQQLQQQSQLQQQTPQIPQQQLRPGSLNPQQMAFMDQQDAHQTISKNLQQHQNWNPSIRKWGELKQWLQENPIATLPIPRIEEAQRAQFAHILQLRQRQQQQAQLQAQQQQPAANIVGQTENQIQQQRQMLQAQQGRPNMASQMNPAMPATFNTQVKPVTPEDIANARRMNPQFQNVPDNKLAALLHQHRVKAIQSRLAEQVPPPQNVFPPPVMGQQPQQSGNQMLRQPSMPGSRPSAPQQIPPTNQTPQAMKQPQTQPQINSQMPPKTLKRPSEAESKQDPQVPQQGTRPQPAQMPTGVPNLSKEQFEKLPPVQQQRYVAAKRLEERNRAAAQLVVKMTNELRNTLPPRKTITNMSAGNKAQVTKLLTQEQTKGMLQRFEPFITQFLLLSSDQEATKQLLSQRLQLVSQYKPQSIKDQTFEVADHFSLTPDQLGPLLQEMFQRFQMTLQKSAQMRQQAQNIQNQGPQPPQQLTPGNLELLERQEAQRRDSKASKNKDVPAAPTTSQSPFTFGDTRGQGTPKYGAAGLKQEDLKLDPKRRKRNPAVGATPATPAAPATPSKAPATVKAEVQGQKADLESSFKCEVPDCEYHNKGFNSQLELDDHSTNAHRPAEEPVEDPLSFFVENLYKSLGLDENGRPVPRKPEQAMLRSIPMEKTASSTSAVVKAELLSKPATPAAPVVGASSTKPISTEVDAWADATVKPELLQDVFSGPDPFVTDFDLEEYIRVYKESDDWKNLPRADPKIGFCADWTEPEELREARERKLEAKVAKLSGGDDKSPARHDENDMKVDLEIEGLDLSSTDFDWDHIEKMKFDEDLNTDSPWEKLSDRSNVEVKQVRPGETTADDFFDMTWLDFPSDRKGKGMMTNFDEDADSNASYESWDWDAMFRDKDNIVPGTNNSQAKRKIVKPKSRKS